MSAEPRHKPITVKEFEKFDPEWRYDLIEGELVPMPPMPGAEHGDITNLHAVYAGMFVIEHDLGRCFAAETRFTIERRPDTAIAPDWGFVAKERLPAIYPKGFLELAPDIVLEVRSPSDRKREVAEKVKRWLAAGVKIVWELDPQTRILTVHRPGSPPRELGIEDILSGEEILPGFQLPLRRLFREEKT